MGRLSPPLQRPYLAHRGPPAPRSDRVSRHTPEPGSVTTGGRCLLLAYFNSPRTWSGFIPTRLLICLFDAVPPRSSSASKSFFSLVSPSGTSFPKTIRG